METSIKSSSKRRIRKKKRERELKLQLVDSKSSSQSFGIKGPLTRKENRKNLKKIREQYLGSFIQGLCKKNVSLNVRQDKDLVEYDHCELDLLQQTIDLCDGDGSIGKCSPNVSRKKNIEPIIDLCQDTAEKNEVIDLTETINTAQVDCNESNGCEPTIIDLSEEDSRDDHNFSPESDEILVIGTFSNNSNFVKKTELPPFISLSSKWNNFNSLISCNKKLKKKYKNKLGPNKCGKKINQFKSNFQKIKEKSDKAAKFAKVGENIYVNSPVALPSQGLRPIIIDGSNVAFVHSNCNFSCKRLEICINYFKEKGHKVTAFVPQYRISSYCSDDPQLLRKLERQGDVIFTPSKKVDGRIIVPYDDRFIVQTAVLKGGIIVSRDNFNDLLKENPAWAETIKYRTLAFTWVDDVLMFPKDPLGENGPTLEDFLRFH